MVLDDEYGEFFMLSIDNLFKEFGAIRSAYQDEIGDEEQSLDLWTNSVDGCEIETAEAYEFYGKRVGIIEDKTMRLIISAISSQLEDSRNSTFKEDSKSQLLSLGDNLC
jgi:hypothetical protein